MIPKLLSFTPDMSSIYRAFCCCRSPRGKKSDTSTTALISSSATDLTSVTSGNPKPIYSKIVPLSTSEGSQFSAVANSVLELPNAHDDLLSGEYVLVEREIPYEYESLVGIIDTESQEGPVSQIVDNAGTTSALADSFRYAVTGIKIALSEARTLNELRALCVLALPGTLKNLYDSGKSLAIALTGREGVNEAGTTAQVCANAGVGIVNSIGGLADFTGTTISFLQNASLIGDFATVADSMFCTMGVTNVVQICWQTYVLGSTCNLSAEIEKGDLEDARVAIANKVDFIAKNIFGMKKSTLSTSLDLIQRSGKEAHKKDAHIALKGRIKTSKWCQALSILIGVIKLIGLAFLLFSPLNVLVAIGFAVGAVAILCTVAIVAYDSYSKKKFREEMKGIMLKVTNENRATAQSTGQQLVA